MGPRSRHDPDALLIRLLALLLVACRGASVPQPARTVVATELTVDVTAHTGRAAITFGSGAHASLEVGDLAIASVTADGVTMAPRIVPGRHGGVLELDDPRTVVIDYRWKLHEPFTGAAAGFTFVWPYYCGNLFPCHSSPAEGTAFTLAVTGVPADQTAIYAGAIAQVPSYQVAWSIGAYNEKLLGTTAANTTVSIWYLPGDDNAMTTGTAHLVAAFDWLERTIGPYRFGRHVGSVDVAWPAGGFGGMEHHPRWHISRAQLASEIAHVHEATHGWFGDGVRLACWEDFVLSEGTTTYLAARALDAVAPEAGAAAWQHLAGELATLSGDELVWPAGCGAIDILADHLLGPAPYVRGAMFYRAVAEVVGAAKLDAALAAFYRAHAGRAARMSDMLATIASVTGFDPTACADAWLRSRRIPAGC